MKRRMEGDFVYSLAAQYYDRIYSFKDYAAEAEKLVGWIEAHRRSTGRRLLDVACGTGRHLEHLAGAYDAEGLDLSADLLTAAQKRNPTLTFHCADMRSFRLPGTYDVITCLFSAIGYMTTVEDLHQAVGTMVRHLPPGGVLIIEPWLTPDAWKEGTVHGMLIDDPEIKIARMNTSLTRGRLSVFDLHHLVGTPEKTIHFVEHHELRLYTVEEMTAALETAGLSVVLEPEGLTGRGLYIGIRPDG